MTTLWRVYVGCAMDSDRRKELARLRQRRHMYHMSVPRSCENECCAIPHVAGSASFNAVTFLVAERISARLIIWDLFSLTIMCIEHYLKIHRKNEKRKRQERKCTKEANIIKYIESASTA